MRIAVILSAFIVAGGAQAADLRGYKKSVPMPPAAAPMFTWAGAYVGLHAGYGFGENNADTTGTPLFNTLIAPGIVPASLKTGRDGFLGGAQIGYNYQLGGLVAGVEADFSIMPKGRDSGFIGGPVLGTQLLTSASSEMRWFGTARARLGFAIDTLLLYGTGGLAFAELRSGASVQGIQAPGLVWADTKTDTKFGWTAGVGAEWAFAPNWSLKGEYLYYDLGKTNLTAIGNTAVRGVAALNGIDYATSITNRGSIGRAGINYRF